MIIFLSQEIIFFQLFAGLLVGRRSKENVCGRQLVEIDQSQRSDYLVGSHSEKKVPGYLSCNNNIAVEECGERRSFWSIFSYFVSTTHRVSALLAAAVVGCEVKLASVIDVDVVAVDD